MTEAAELTRDKILKSSLLIVFLSLMSYFAEYGVNLSLTKLLKPDDFGDYAVAMSWVVLWSNITSLGAAKSIVRFFPGYFSSNDKARGVGIVYFYSWASAAIGALVALVGMTLAYLNVGNFYKSNLEGFHPLVIALFMLPLVSWCNIRAAVLQSRSEYFWSTSPTKIILPLLFLGLVWSSQKWHYVATDRFMVLLMMASYAVIYFSQNLLLKFIAKVKLITAKKIIEPKAWLSLSLPIMLINITFYVSSQADLTMIELLLPNENDLGYFAAATKIAWLLFILSGAVGTVIMPMIGPALEKGQQAAQKLYSLAFTLNFVISIGTLICIAFFKTAILAMFGPNYPTAGPALLILMIGYACNTLTSPAMYFLQYSKFGKYMLMFDVVAMLANIGLNWWFIPQYGMVGAALATTLTLALAAVGRFSLAWIKMHLTPL